MIGISDQFKIPVRYIGVGEGIDQLQVFDRREFVDSLFGNKNRPAKPQRFRSGKSAPHRRRKPILRI